MDCIAAAGFTDDSTHEIAPFTLRSSQSMSVPVPTLTSTTQETQSTKNIPFHAEQRISYVQVMMIMIPKTFTGNVDTAGHASDMFTYLKDTVGCDMGTLTSVTFAINTCGSEGFHISGGGAEVLDLHNGLVISTMAAQSFNGAHGSQQAAVLNVYINEMSSGAVQSEEKDLTAVTDAQREYIVRPWAISMIATACVFALCIGGFLYYFMMYHRHRPLHEHEIQRGMIHHMRDRATAFGSLPGGTRTSFSNLRRNSLLGSQYQTI